MVAAVAAGTICGILSGFGIGGGSLLMVWMTAVLSMNHPTARAINLMYFLPTAIGSLYFHMKNKQIVWRASIPAMIAGVITAGGSAWLSSMMDGDVLRKIFGGFLLLVGLSEWFKKPKKQETPKK